jgi:hypothetical protein
LVSTAFADEATSSSNQQAQQANRFITTSLDSRNFGHRIIPSLYDIAK